MTPFDLKRLESYANNMLDYHVILDLMPSVAELYFQKRLGSGSSSNDAQNSGEGPLRLTAVQSSILLAMGLQRKTIEELEVLYTFAFMAPRQADSNICRPNSSSQCHRSSPSSPRSSGR